MMAAPDRPLKQNRLLGIGLRVGAATCFGFMAAMIKLGAEAGVSLPELAFYRFAFGLPPLLVWIALTGSFGAWRTKRPLAHLWRGTIGLTTMVTAFAALTFLPLAEAATIGFVAPLFSVMLSALILSEPVGRHRWTAVVMGLIGVLIVMRPGGSHMPGARPRPRLARRARRRRRDDHPAPDRQDRTDADHRALVHLLRDGRDRPVPALLRPGARRARPGRSWSRSACSAASASSS